MIFASAGIGEGAADDLFHHSVVEINAGAEDCHIRGLVHCCAGIPVGAQAGKNEGASVEATRLQLSPKLGNGGAHLFLQLAHVAHQ